MPFKCNLPKYNSASLLDSVPEEDRPENEADFWKAVAVELSTMIEYASNASQPQIIFNDVTHSGTQYFWEFYVNDLAKTWEGKYNWHGQNTSQWNYAGAILLQNRKVSTHH